MNSCELLKHHLLKHGRDSALQHEQLGVHAQNCAACRALLRSWTRIPGLLDKLPEHEPSEALCQRTRKAITDTGSDPAVNIRRLPRLATSLASAAVLLAAIGLSRQLFDHESPSLRTPALREEYEIADKITPEYAPGKLERSGAHTNAPQGEEVMRYLVNEREERGVGVIADSRVAGIDQKSKDGDRLRLNKQDAGRTQIMESDALLDGFPDDENRAPAALRSRLDEANNASIFHDEISEILRSGVREPPPSVALAHHKPPKRPLGHILNSGTVSTVESGPESGAMFGKKSDFLGYYQATESLHFQPAQGYWANTHVPGDPNIRLLRARLAAWDRSGHAQRLEQDVMPVSQPFDAPADNALALSLMSDANAVDGPTRMRLQVGIRGIEHRRGQRPAMNMAVVIDLPTDADDGTRIGARALLDALLAAKQPGDHFSLVLNGPGGLLVPPDDFRFGPLQLARQAILGVAPPVSGKNMVLADAVRQAARFVRQSDDPSQPLGSSSILLISANTLDDVDALSTQIHAQAREGTTLSVVPLGNLPERSQVETLVLAGLGSRRILEAPGQARQLVEAELHSSSRAVARAARLSIRLAPGVRLIDVVGSRRLDPERSQRVRAIENSMDRRLSANLGIQADRGEDEDGIQIVIPSIFSGDDVTVLVDVLVDRPGDIASVSLRYKDLVYLRNGKLSGQLSLPAGALDRGAAENAVLKNLLAHHFSAAVGRAADALGRQQSVVAAAILAAMRDEIATLRARVPAFRNDPELQRDQQILARYITILASSGAHQPELTDSLRYAAWAKVHRPLAEWKK